jgi:hypothetical protein
MATAKKTAPADSKPAGKKAGTAVVKWDEELAKRARNAHRVAANVGSGGGNYLSFKGGKLSFKDVAIKSNRLDIVVLAAVAENNYFDGPYDPKSPQSPLCYAFGRPDGDDDDMKPHEQVFKDGNNQSDFCRNCEHNEWGSAAKGRGKACKNQVKLCFIPADALEKDGAVAKEEAVYAKLPVTSGKHWSRYINELGDKHFLQFVTTLCLESDEGEETYHVVFEAKEEITGEVIGELVARSDKEERNMGVAYPKFEEQERRPARKGAARPAPTKGVAAKPRKFARA